MYACADCGCTTDELVCDNCGCTELVELGICENCGCLSTLEDHDRFGLCGADGNNCQEDEELVEAFEDNIIGFIMEASDRLLK